MRLIDADKLFACWGEYKLSDAVKYGNKNEEQRHWSYQTLMMYEFADVIADAPTIDAVPVVRGRWVLVDESTAACSACGDCVDEDSPFCPNCGAKMDLDDELIDFDYGKDGE